MMSWNGGWGESSEWMDGQREGRRGGGRGDRGRTFGADESEKPVTEWQMEERWWIRRAENCKNEMAALRRMKWEGGDGEGRSGWEGGGAVVSKMTYLRRYGEEKECGFFWLGFLLKSFSKCGACLLQGEPQHFRKAWKEIKWFNRGQHLNEVPQLRRNGWIWSRFSRKVEKLWKETVESCSVDDNNKYIFVIKM